MSKKEKIQKILAKILAGSRNVKFNEFVYLIEGYGFHESRTKGSHHVFTHPGIDELLNIQNVNGQAKPYQIKQFLNLVEKYDLKLEAVQ